MKFIQNTKLFIHENAFKNVVWEIRSILFRGRWVSEITCIPKLSPKHPLHWAFYVEISTALDQHNMYLYTDACVTLQWRHNGRNCVSNHQPRHCLLNRLFRRRSKKTSKHRVAGLCVGNSAVTNEFPAQMASNAENVSIWWRHHELYCQDAILTKK